MKNNVHKLPKEYKIRNMKTKYITFKLLILHKN